MKRNDMKENKEQALGEPIVREHDCGEGSLGNASLWHLKSAKQKE